MIHNPSGKLQQLQSIEMPLYTTDLMSWSWLLLLLVIPSLLLLLKPRKQSHLPPGPRGLPVIGNIHQLGSLPHRSLHRLSAYHGPVMHLRLGRIPTLIVSSATAAREIFKTHDVAFCSRPSLVAWQRLSYGGLDLAFVPYGPYWRQMRKLSAAHLFSTHKGNSFRHIREQEVDVLVRTVAGSAMNSAPVNLSELFLSLLENITFRMVFGKRVEKDGEFHAMIKETVALMGGFCAGDFFPAMPWLNVLTGVHGRLERNFAEMDRFLEVEIEDAVRRRDGESFAGVLLGLKDDPSLDFPLSKDHIKAILMVTYIAATDSSATSLVWAMSELMKNPKVLYKAQDEIKRVNASRNNKLEESDLPHLKYLNSVVKETLRLHPPGPLLLPRESIEDCNICGYDVPAKTRVYINAWAIGRDPNKWEDPEVFYPERFEDMRCNVDYKGQHFELVPFGGGRRICPGLPLAQATMELALAALLGNFEWALPKGMNKEDVDMSESFGIVVTKKVPLLLMATPRD